MCHPPSRLHSAWRWWQRSTLACVVSQLLSGRRKISNLTAKARRDGDDLTGPRPWFREQNWKIGYSSRQCPDDIGTTLNPHQLCPVVDGSAVRLSAFDKLPLYLNQAEETVSAVSTLKCITRSSFHWSGNLRHQLQANHRLSATAPTIGKRSQKINLLSRCCGCGCQNSSKMQ